MTIPQDEFKRVLRERAGGVTIVTMRVGDRRHGLTVMDWCAVSLVPPLVLICIGNDLRSHALLQEGRAFAVNLLGDDQRALADRFAGRVPGVEDRLADVPYGTAVTGAPILAECRAWLDCTIVNALVAGDHTIYVGHVEAGEPVRDGPPLLYYNGDYRTVV